MTEKQCTKCGESKQLDEFYRQPKGMYGRCAACKTCAREYGREYQRQLDPQIKQEYSRKWRERNRDRFHQQQRRQYLKNGNQEKGHKYHVRRRFGLTAAQYAAMVEAQGNRCAICGRPETVKRGGKLQRLAVDHNHETGEVRALLCTGCNQMLGRARDNPHVLQAAIAYLGGSF